MQLVTCALLAVCLGVLMLASAPAGVSAVPAPGRVPAVSLDQLLGTADGGEAPLQTNKRFWGAFLVGAAVAKITGKRDQPLANEETPLENSKRIPLIPVLIGAGIVILAKGKRSLADEAPIETAAQLPTLLLLEETSQDDLARGGAERNSICIGLTCAFWPEELSVVTNQEVKVTEVELDDGQVGVVSETKRSAAAEETVEKRTWSCGLCVGPSCKGLWSCGGCVGSNCGK